MLHAFSLQFFVEKVPHDSLGHWNIVVTSGNKDAQQRADENMIDIEL
jgi:hypothetical protein